MGCHSKFARCSAVVIEVFSKILQDLLATRISAGTLYNIVINNNNFKKKLSRREMITIQTLLTDDFSKFDVTLIYKIVKFFNFIQSPTRSWGANPLANEIEIGDDVERIRLARNDFVHRIKCDMNDSEFQTFFTCFGQLGMRVDIHLGKSENSGFHKDIENYKTIPIDDHMEEMYIAALKQIEDLQEKAKLTTKNEKIIIVYCGKSMDEMIDNIREEAGASHSAVKIIINGIENTKEIAHSLNSLGDQLTDVNIIFNKAREGSLILHVGMRKTILKEVSVFARCIMCFLERVFSLANCDSVVTRETGIVIVKDDDEMYSNEHDDMEETFLDSIGKRSLILDVEVTNDVFHGTGFEKRIMEYLEENIIKINRTEVFPDKEITTIISPRDMGIPDLCAYSIYVSNILTANGITLPVVKLRRDESMYTFNVLNTFNGHHTEPTEMPCGSRAEGLAMLAGRANLASSDEDVIIFANDFEVYEERSEIEALYSSHPKSCPILRIPDATCPGYSKLVLLKNNSKLTKFGEFQGQNCFLKNSLKERIVDRFDKLYHYTIHGPAVKVELLSKTTPSLHKSERTRPKKIDFKTKEFVLCLKGQSWPDEACEWTTRKRPSDWPSRELFDNIIKSGYLLAGVGHKEYKESEIQWRVSFNRAEQLIIESFNETQVHCLILLKLLKGCKLFKVAGKIITSYTMKIVMFWSLEEIPNEFWKPAKLLYCFCFCLLKLKSFIDEEFLPDYFVRNRNHFISSELTRDEKHHTKHLLIRFLRDPKENIHTLLYSYNLNNVHQYLSNSILEVAGQEMFIKVWLCIRISMAEDFHDLIEDAFCNLYYGYNVNNILLRCNNVSEKLTRINYAQPFIKLLQNCMCVLEYMLLRKEKENIGHTTHSGTQQQCSDNMELSLAADRTHTALRVATCLLDEGANKRNRCIALIRSVTDHHYSHLYMQSYRDVKREKLENFTIQAFEKLQPTCLLNEIPTYNKIISQDLKYQDPYRTIEQFKLFKEQGYQVGWHSVFLLVWEQCWFDVTFMPAELPVLPKPAALELCIDNTQKKISFHPFLYGLLLEFLWHAKYSPKKEKAGIVLEKMKSSIEMTPHQQQSIGLNFITYCCSIQNDYRSASQYLIRSFKFNPVKQNVAYLYIKYIVNIMRELSSIDFK